MFVVLSMFNPTNKFCLTQTAKSPPKFYFCEGVVPDIGTVFFRIADFTGCYKLLVVLVWYVSACSAGCAKCKETEDSGPTNYETTCEACIPGFTLNADGICNRKSVIGYSGVAIGLAGQTKSRGLVSSGAPSSIQAA